MSPTDIVLQVAGVLDALGVPYVLVGSMASSAHGFPRTTNDADVVADLALPQAEPLVSALTPDYYVDRSAVDRAIVQFRSFNVIHVASAFKVDVFVPRPDGFGRQQLARRSREPLGPGLEAPSLYVATAEDVVLSKLQWYRASGDASDRQWHDLVGVMKIQGGSLDRSYLQEWATRLGLSPLLERAFAEAGEAT